MGVEKVKMSIPLKKDPWIFLPLQDTPTYLELANKTSGTSFYCSESR